MKVFFVAGLEGSTACFRKFLTALESYEADVGILLGDLTGRRVVSLIQKGPDRWDVPIDGKILTIDSSTAFADTTSAIEDRGDYWVEQTQDELDRTAASPLMIDLLFKSLARQRVERWLGLADARLRDDGPKVYVAPGCGDWAIIDDLFEGNHKMAPCDNRIVHLNGHEMLTCSASGPTDWDLAREIDERELHDRLLSLCSGLGDPDYAIFNLQADSRAAQKIVKRYQPMLRLLGAVQGNTGGARKRGRTIELSPRAELIEDATRSLHGVLAMLEGGEVKDYVFTDG
jgi:uncharacterized protein